MQAVSNAFGAVHARDCRRSNAFTASTTRSQRRALRVAAAEVGACTRKPLAHVVSLHRSHAAATPAERSVAPCTRLTCTAEGRRFPEVPGLPASSGHREQQCRVVMWQQQGRLILTLLHPRPCAQPPLTPSQQPGPGSSPVPQHAQRPPNPHVHHAPPPPAPPASRSPRAAPRRHATTHTHTQSPSWWGQRSGSSLARCRS